MNDVKTLNSMMTKLQLAEINIMPAIEQIVRTTLIYSEYEFKEKLRNNEPIFCLHRAEFTRAVEACRLLSEVKNDLKFAGLISEQHSANYNITLASSDSINFVQPKAKVEKSIASSMKEIIVNRLTIYPKNAAPSNKVYLNEDKIKQLMQLHENIIGTIDMLQDKGFKKKTDALVKDLEKLQDLSSTQQSNQNKKPTKVNVKFKTKRKKLYVSNKTPKKFIILSPKDDNVYNNILTDNQAVDYEDMVESRKREREENLARESLQPDGSLGFQFGRTINLDIGKIEYRTSSIGTIENEAINKSSNDINNAHERNNEIINETVNAKIPNEAIDEEDIKLQNMSEAKQILRACLEKLIYIRNRLNETAESSIKLNNKIKISMEQNEDDKNYTNIKDAEIDFRQEYVKQNNDMWTDFRELDQFENPAKFETGRTRTCEFHRLLKNVLKQINCMQHMVIGKKDYQTVKKNSAIGYTQPEVSFPPNPPNLRESMICEIISNQNDQNQKNTNNLEKVRNIVNTTSKALSNCSSCFKIKKEIKTQDSESNWEGTDICPTKLMNVKSVLQILCARDIYHPNSRVKQQLNNIGLQKLISSAGPSKCSKLVIVNDPRDLPDMPFKASLNSLPLSESDLAIIQNNVDRMKKMLNS